MASARINIKNIDYFKYKKLIIDGNRDDYSACSKEVKCFCDSVQTINFRDEEFDDVTDRDRFAEIIGCYRQILASRRIEPVDMRIKSGWWGEQKNAYSAGKLKPAVLREKLVAKVKDWNHRHGGSMTSTTDIDKCLDGPGLYVLKHKEHHSFQYVGRAAKILVKVAEKFKQAFEGTSEEPLSALLIISTCNDWDFYFKSVADKDGEDILRILENDLVLRHDSIWPHGLNFQLHIDSLLEVSEFRKSCLRHHWPPDGDTIAEQIDMVQLRSQVTSAPTELAVPPMPPPVKTKAVKQKPPFVLTDDEDFPSVSADEDDTPTDERAHSPSSSAFSTSTFVVVEGDSSPETVNDDKKPPVRTPAPVSRPLSAGKMKDVKKLGSQGSASPAKKPASTSRPTTPRTPKSRTNGAKTNHNGDMNGQDKNDDGMQRSCSASSLSSSEGKRGGRAATDSPSKKAGARTPRQRPTSGRTKPPDQSRLPVAGGKK